MEDILKYVVTNVPNFAGFAILAYVLWRMNEKLLDAVLTRLDKLEEKVEALIFDSKR